MDYQNSKKYQIAPFKYKEVSQIQLKSYCTEIALNHSQSILAISLWSGHQKFYFLKSGEHKLIGNFNKIDNTIWLYFFKSSKLYSSLNSRSTYSIWI